MSVTSWKESLHSYASRFAPSLSRLCATLKMDIYHVVPCSFSRELSCVQSCMPHSFIFLALRSCKLSMYQPALHWIYMHFVESLVTTQSMIPEHPTLRLVRCLYAYDQLTYCFAVSHLNYWNAIKKNRLCCNQVMRADIVEEDLDDMRQKFQTLQGECAKHKAELVAANGRIQEEQKSVCRLLLFGLILCTCFCSEHWNTSNENIISNWMVLQWKRSLSCAITLFSLLRCVDPGQY